LEVVAMATVRRVALITGGGQGIGKGIVRHLVSLGITVAIAEIDVDAGREAEDTFQQLGTVKFFETDVGEEASVEETIRETLDCFGRLDALVNNAGIAHPVIAPVHKLSLADWDRVIRTNLTGMFLTVKHSVQYLKSTRGAIVNISSTRAMQSEPNTEAYSASKGGVLALTHSLAMSLGPAIRVNCISPGWIDVSEWKKGKQVKKAVLTEQDHAQHPVGRVGIPQDIAALVAFLISEEAAFITGQNFVVDGGMTKKMIYED
jgi:NAD(P)-dependent dehydrogenase (short-subunit alcohol dehydrogenase family)